MTMGGFAITRRFKSPGEFPLAFAGALFMF